MSENEESVIYSVDGPVVKAKNMDNVGIGNQVLVGDIGLIGEVIELTEKYGVIQVYEDTTGLKPGMEIKDLGHSLSVELGPGLLKSTYDGIQRPLDATAEESGDFIQRGVKVDNLDKEKEWHFIPLMEEGEEVKANSRLGKVPETEVLDHYIIPPPGIEGEIVQLAEEGKYSLEETIAEVKTASGDIKEISMVQRWGVRTPRPYIDRLSPSTPLITGQRVIDFLFPLTKGGVAAVPGGFGTGKTVIQHQLAKWSNADIIIYIGCGERGNEMTQVLEEFPRLEDPRTGKPIIERTVLIANTSNMPVTAREASIYTGITIGEYFRDMGYDVAIMADSTSRWAEALREISSRLEEMPAERGFPAYLASRLAEFYERGGRMRVSENNNGSVTIIGAVSPPGGDFSEPVTQHTKRVTKTFWALDKELASQRHFPSINWDQSYSGYVDDLTEWWSEEHEDINWEDLREKVGKILQEDGRLQRVVQLVGPDALPDSQRLTYELAKIIKEGFLQQNAFHEIDSFCSLQKQVYIIKIILKFYSLGQDLIELGVPVMKIMNLDITDNIQRMKNQIPNDNLEEFERIEEELEVQIDELRDQYS